MPVSSIWRKAVLGVHLVSSSTWLLASATTVGQNISIPSPAFDISTDGSCGNGITCVGSQWGRCCSEHGFCGNDAAYCGVGCQATFGSCEGELCSSVCASRASDGPTLTVTTTDTICRVTLTATRWQTATTTACVGSGCVNTCARYTETTTVRTTATQTTKITLTSKVLETLTVSPDGKGAQPVVTSTTISTITRTILTQETTTVTKYFRRPPTGSAPTVPGATLPTESPQVVTTTARQSTTAAAPVPTPAQRIPATANCKQTPTR